MLGDLLAEKDHQLAEAQMPKAVSVEAEGEQRILLAVREELIRRVGSIEGDSTASVIQTALMRLLQSVEARSREDEARHQSAIETEKSEHQRLLAETESSWTTQVTALQATTLQLTEALSRQQKVAEVELSRALEAQHHRAEEQLRATLEDQESVASIRLQESAQVQEQQTSAHQAQVQEVTNYYQQQLDEATARSEELGKALEAAQIQLHQIESGAEATQSDQVRSLQETVGELQRQLVDSAEQRRDLESIHEHNQKALTEANQQLLHELGAAKSSFGSEVATVRETNRRLNEELTAALQQKTEAILHAQKIETLTSEITEELKLKILDLEKREGQITDEVLLQQLVV